MVLTPLAESLVDPVREFLMQAPAIIDERPQFDPSTSTRRFRMMMSDYVAAVLMPQVLPRVKQLAPSIGIAFCSLKRPRPKRWWIASKWTC